MFESGIQPSIPSKLDSKIVSETGEIDVPILEVDFQKILGSSRVLMIGERHKNVTAREHLLGWVNRLKALGITHYGIEANNKNPDVMRRLNNREPVDLLDIDVGPADYSKRFEYELLMKTMSDAGICVVPLCDLRNDRVNYDRIKGEEGTADEIKTILDSDPSNRMVVLIGFDHAAKHGDLSSGGPPNPSAATRLVDQGIPTTSVRYFGGFGGDSYSGTLADIIRRNNLSDEVFMIETASCPEVFGEDARNFDFFIHVPNKFPSEYEFDIHKR